MSISVRNIRKTHGRFAALDDVSLDAPSGKLVALLGPSGPQDHAAAPDRRS